MRHGWRFDCSFELIQASSVVARYRQNFPTLSAGTSPRFAIRSRTFGWIFKTCDASLVVRSVSIPCDIPLSACRGTSNSIPVPREVVWCSITESSPIRIALDRSPLMSSTRAHKLRSSACCSGRIPVLSLYLCPCHPIDLIC